MTLRRGFSLIELSLALAISGLMVGFALQSQQATATADCYASTRLQLIDINGAIQRFARKNDRLPLPAARDVGVEGVTYGREAGGAAIDVAGTTSWGALPFQALGLNTSYAADCWGNKFTYYVSELLTALSRGGVAVLMATHDLFRAKECGNRVGIMKHGRLVPTMATSEIGHTELEAIYLEHMRN